MEKFICLQDYVMKTGQVAFEKGETYDIEKKGINTYKTISNIGNHELDGEDLNYYFKSLKELEQTPKHYDNTKGSLYQFCENQQLNAYEFDIIKRVMRCRKKGNFKEDLEKTKFLINLYIKEYEKTGSK